jgi:hypothetical protein
MRGSTALPRSQTADVVLEPAESPITIPDALLFGEFKRLGDNLKITGEDGKSVLVLDYFQTDRPAALMAPSGASLSGETVAVLAGPRAAGQYAQAGAPAASAAQSQIGAVDKVTGSITVMRGGVSVALNNGDQILKGDVILTGTNSSVTIIMVDGTALNLSASTRMAMNEFSFDANSTNNVSLLSLVQGSFAAIAGQIAPTGGLMIETPVATMGIRGTHVAAGCAASNCNFVAAEGGYDLIHVNPSTGQQTIIGRVTVATAASVNASTTPGMPPAATFTPSAAVATDPNFAGLQTMVQQLVQVYPQMFVPQPTPPTPTDPGADPNAPNAPQGTTPQRSGENGSSTPGNILLQNNAPKQQAANTPPVTQTVATVPDTSTAQPTVVTVVFTPPPTTNLSPTVSSPIETQNSPEDLPWTFTIPAGTFSDPEGAPLTYTATLADGGALPNWLNFNPANQTFEGIPPPNANGTVPLRVVASDNASSVAHLFTLNITPVNDAPVLTLPGNTASVVEDTFEDLVGGLVVDPDAGEVLTLRLTLAEGTFDTDGPLPVIPGLVI